MRVAKVSFPILETLDFISTSIYSPAILTWSPINRRKTTKWQRAVGSTHLRQRRRQWLKAGRGDQPQEASPPVLKWNDPRQIVAAPVAASRASQCSPLSSYRGKADPKGGGIERGTSSDVEQEM